MTSFLIGIGVGGLSVAALALAAISQGRRDRGEDGEWRRQARRDGWFV